MSKKLKLDKETSGIRAAVLTKDIKYNLKLAAVSSGTTMSDMLRELVIAFNARIEIENINDLIISYCGKDLYTSKDTESTTFRIENDVYKKFCHYSLCIGNDPSELLRKLVLERLNMPIATFMPYHIDDINEAV